MIKGKKIIFVASLVLVGVAVVGYSASAALISPPDYTSIVTASSTTFGGALFTDLLPWLGLFLIITVTGLIVSALARRIIGAMKRLFGGGRRRGGRRRFR